MLTESARQGRKWKLLSRLLRRPGLKPGIPSRRNPPFGTAPDGRPVHSSLDFHPENRSGRIPSLGGLLNAWEKSSHSRPFQGVY